MLWNDWVVFTTYHLPGVQLICKTFKCHAFCWVLNQNSNDFCGENRSTETAIFFPNNSDLNWLSVSSLKSWPIDAFKIYLTICWLLNTKIEQWVSSCKISSPMSKFWNSTPTRIWRWELPTWSNLVFNQSINYFNELFATFCRHLSQFFCCYRVQNWRPVKLGHRKNW